MIAAVDHTAVGSHHAGLGNHPAAAYFAACMDPFGNLGPSDDDLPSFAKESTYKVLKICTKRILTRLHERNEIYVWNNYSEQINLRNTSFICISSLKSELSSTDNRLR